MRPFVKLLFVMVVVEQNEASSRPTSPRRSPSPRSDKPAVQLEPAPCCAASDGLAVLVGNLRSDVDETLLKDRLTQLLQRRMLQVGHRPADK